MKSILGSILIWSRLVVKRSASTTVFILKVSRKHTCVLSRGDVSLLISAMGTATWSVSTFTESTARALALQIAARARIVDLIFFSMTLYLVDRIIKLDDV